MKVETKNVFVFMFTLDGLEKTADIPWRSRCQDVESYVEIEG